MPLSESTVEQLRRLGSPMNLLNEKKVIRAYFYGDYGVGKTTLLADILKHLDGDVAYFSTDSGWSSLQRWPEVADRVYRYKWDGLNQVKMMVQAHEEGIDPFSGQQTFVFDTISTAIDITLRRMVDTKKYKDQIDNDAEGRTHYRLLSRYLRETVDVLSKSDLNVIYLSHVREPSEDDKQRRKFNIRPNAPETSFNIIAQEVQLIGWLYREENGQRKIQFAPTNKESAKTQIPTIEEKTYLANEVPELIRKWIDS